MPLTCPHAPLLAPALQVSEHARKRDRENSRYISILNIIQGDVDPTQVKALTKLTDAAFASLHETNM